MERNIQVEQNKNGVTVSGPYEDMVHVKDGLKKLGFKWRPRRGWLLSNDKLIALPPRKVEQLNHDLQRAGARQRIWLHYGGALRLDLVEYPSSATLYGVPDDPATERALKDAGFQEYKGVWSSTLADIEPEDWALAARALRPHGLDIGPQPRPPARGFKLPDPTGTIRTISPSQMKPQVFMGRQAPDPKRLLKNKPVRTHDGFNKPGGRPVWTSSQEGRSSDWLDYCSGSYGYTKARGTQAVILKVKPGAKIVLVHTRDDYEAVQSRYPQTGARGQDFIDWKALAKDYDALHATSNGAHGVFNHAGNTGTKWDVESTVWWNAAACLEIDKIIAVDVEGENEKCLLRLAARYLTAINCGRMYSTAWIDPKGNTHEMRGNETHDSWAATWLAKHDARRAPNLTGEQYSKALMARGWVKASSFREFEIGMMPKPKAMEEAARMCADCIQARSMNPEQVQVTVWNQLGRSSKMSAPNFIERHGGTAMLDSLFEHMLARVATRWLRASTG